MILAIDIGNTNITCGVFYNDKLLYKTSIASKNVENNSYYVFFENIRKNYKISYVYIISVNMSGIKYFFKSLKCFYIQTSINPYI